MSPLEEAMLEQMAYLVFNEQRPFCHNDFLRFEYNGEEYKPKYGTVRNIFSKFTKEERIEYEFRDVNAYYTLKGHKFGKNSMTVYHTRGNSSIAISPNHPLYQMLKNQMMDKQAIHNIRLSLKVPNIFTYSYATLQYFDQDEVSRDFRLPYWNIDNAQVQVRVHRTDSITVIIGCSLNPIPLDYNGLIRLYKILGIVQGYLEGLTFNHNVVHIPDFDDWTITMWHFNRDGLKEYTGEKFSITVEKAKHTIERIYTKDFVNTAKRPETRIRIETQEYPNKTVKEVKEEICDEKLNVTDIGNAQV